MATALAKLANLDGGQSLGGKLAMLLVYTTPWDSTSAFEIIFFAFFELETNIDKLGDFSFFSFL